MQLFFIAIGYLVGSIPFGWLAVKLLRKEDLRRSGSGATGATNVGRKLGVRWGIAIASLDVLKAFIPTLLAISIWPDADWLHVGVVAAACLGHSKSIFLGFSGGKAVSTSAGGTLAITFTEPIIGVVIIIALAVFIMVIRITDRMSAGSLIGTAAGACFTAVLLILGAIPLWYGWGLIVLVIYIWLTHLENIRRLLRGQERRLNWIRKGG